MGQKSRFDEVGREFGDRVPRQKSLAVALMQALQGYSGGVPGVLDSLRRNGLADLITIWATGRQNTATPQQVHQGLHGIGLIEGTAERAGVSHDAAAAAIASLLPALIRHFAPGGHAPQPVRGDQLFIRPR